MTIKLLAACVLLPVALLQAQPPQRFDVVITELMPDPSPPVGLPNAEYVELRNISNRAINLQGWKLSDGSSTATIRTDFELQPDSQLIICANSAAALLGAFGTAIGVTNFPSLNNDVDVIALLSPEGAVIHAVAYSDQWYQSSIKISGGWSLEMIDVKNPCTGAGNWKATVHHSGGTPGRENSVKERNADETPPALLRTFAPDSMTVIAVFDESLDSLQASIPGRYFIDQGMGQPQRAEPQAPLFREVRLTLNDPLKGVVSTLTIKEVADCSGNRIGSLNTAKVGLAKSPAAGDVVINELLFNPPAGGVDYIELYNRSDKVIDLMQLYVANRSVAGKFTNIQQLTSNSNLLFPGEYRVLTEDSRWVQQQYTGAVPGVMVQLTALPSLPDEEGVLVLTDPQEAVIDELHYNSSWQFALLGNDEGVALERIDYSQPAQNSQNWMSAASTAGYGTPGYRNSQFRADLQAKGMVDLSPVLFSPDNDGRDDFVNVLYQMAEPGFVANITLFDAAGMPVRHLARNATLGREGAFRWDGLDNNRRSLPVGVYVMYAEIFNTQGKTKKFKKTVTLIRHL